MTGDRLWATGTDKSDTQIDPETLSAGKNLVGRAIAKVKNGFILEEIRAGRREPDQVEDKESPKGSVRDSEENISKSECSDSTEK